MNAKGYRKALDTLELTQVRASALLGVEPRTSRRWLSGVAPVPKAVALVLLFMIKHNLTADDMDRLLGPPAKKKRSRAISAAP